MTSTTTRTASTDSSLGGKATPGDRKTSDAIIIDGYYYDTTKLAAIHPGGPLNVLLCNRQDGTTMFNSYHRRRFPHEKYTQMRLSETEVSPEVLAIPHNKQDFTFYFELCDKIRPIIAPTRGFAPWHYFLKAAPLVSLALFVDLVLPLFMRRPTWLSMILGLLNGFIGLEVQHDANHGALSANPRVNRLLGLTQDYIGGSSLMWMKNHNTIHHVHTNDTGLDHDLAIPMLRLHTGIEWHVPHVVQQFYVIVLEALFGPVHILTTLMSLWSETEPREHVLKDYYRTSRILGLLVPSLRLLTLMVHCYSLGDAVTQMLAMSMVGGLYLAFFFLLSHNFDGARKEGIDSLSGDFVKNQVETSSNVGGSVLSQVNGGLNYQIEHHLFPRVNHNYYDKICPIVRNEVIPRGIRYIHFSTVLENTGSTFLHLLKLGRRPMEGGEMSSAKL